MKLTALLLAGFAATLLTGCATFHKKPKVTLAIHEQASGGEPENWIHTANVPGGLTLTLHNLPLLTEREVARAELVPSPGGPSILLQLDAHGMMRLEEVTTRSRGSYLVTFINGRPVATWLINRRLDRGQFLVNVPFEEQEAQEIVDALNKAAQDRDKQ